MKKYLTFCLCFLIMLTYLPQISLAEETTDMVYAPPQVQDYLYDLIQTELASEEYNYEKQQIIENNCKIVKETISPLYEFDLVEYARSNKTDIVPYQPKNHNLDSSYHCYAAKMIFSNGEFAGNLRFFVKDGKVVFDYLSYGYVMDTLNRDNYKQHIISASYADHAERIRKILNREEFVDVSDVRLVHVPCIGHAFWIENGDKFPIIIPARFQNNPNKSHTSQYIEQYTDKIIDEETLLPIAQNELKAFDDYQELLRKWEEEHPGETPLFLGYMFGSISTFYLCSEVDNISNVYEYLGINPDDYRGELDLGIFEFSEAPLESTVPLESTESDTSESSVESVLTDDTNISNSSEPAQESDGKVGIWVIVACGILLLIGGLVFVKTRKKE